MSQLRLSGDVWNNWGAKIMKRQTGMALGVGAGYLLGRSHKTRLALMLAAAGATGKLGLPGQLIRGATGPASGVLSKIAEDVPGRLVEAGRAAATAAATSKVDSLVDTLHSQTEALRRPTVPGDSEGREKPSERARRDESDRESDYDEEVDEGEEEQEEPAPVRGRVESRERRRSSADSDSDDEYAPADADGRAGQRADRRRPGDGRPRRSAESAGDDEKRVERRPRGRSGSERNESPIRRTRR